MKTLTQLVSEVWSWDQKGSWLCDGSRNFGHKASLTGGWDMGSSISVRHKTAVEAVETIFHFPTIWGSKGCASSWQGDGFGLLGSGFFDSKKNSQLLMNTNPTKWSSREGHREKLTKDKLFHLDSPLDPSLMKIKVCVASQGLLPLNGQLIYPGPDWLGMNGGSYNTKTKNL